MCYNLLVDICICLPDLQPTCHLTVLNTEVSAPIPVPPQFDDHDSLNDRLEALFNTFDNDGSG
jgi:hypothetical protein